MRYLASFLAATSILATAVATAKCAWSSTHDRFVEAETVVLVEVTDAHDSPVPYPFVHGEGASYRLPAKNLTLRVVRSWKGLLHPGDTIKGWARKPNIEDAYPDTDVGAQILVFYYKGTHEISACNTAKPERLHEVSKQLDAIVRDGIQGRGS